MFIKGNMLLEDLKWRLQFGAQWESVEFINLSLYSDKVFELFFFHQ